MTSFSLLVYRCHNDKPSIGYPRFELAGAKSQRPKTLVLLFLSCSYNFTTSITITSYFTFLIGSPRIVQYINICTFFMDAHASVFIYMCVWCVVDKWHSLFKHMRASWVPVPLWHLRLWQVEWRKFDRGAYNVMQAWMKWFKYHTHLVCLIATYHVSRDTITTHENIETLQTSLRGALGFRINTSIEWIFDEIIFQRFS